MIYRFFCNFSKSCGEGYCCSYFFKPYIDREPTMDNRGLSTTAALREYACCQDIRDVPMFLNGIS